MSQRPLAARRSPLGIALALALCAGAFAQTVNSAVSVSSAGTFGTGSSDFSQVSDNGRYIVYQSEAADLVAGDVNGSSDIFRHDLQTGVTELVSVASSGTGSSDGQSLSPDISGDGRYCVFQSDASNLVTGDTNGTWDIFRRDMQSGVTERLSLNDSGAEVSERSDNPRIIESGNVVVFDSEAALIPTDTNGHRDVYVLFVPTRALRLVSVTQSGVQGNGPSYHGDMTDYSSAVVFTTDATNLVPSDTNGQSDVLLSRSASAGFWLKRLTFSSGVEANGESSWPRIASYGSIVTFNSRASNLVSGDTNGDYDLFAVNVSTGGIGRVNVRPDGGQSDHSTESRAALSRDGSLIVFASSASDLVPGDTNGRRDVFMRVLSTGTTTRLNLGIADAELNDDSWAPAMTPDGRLLTYGSAATNVLAGDTMNQNQIFARDLRTGDILGTEYCVANPNSTGQPSHLSAVGSLFTSANDVRLEASRLPLNATGIFLVSPTQGFVSLAPPHSGNLCLGLGGYGIGRYVGSGQVQNSGAAGAFSLALDLVRVPSSGGLNSTAPGDTFNFQAWHRDSDLGVLTSNFSQGLSITFQ